MTVDAIQRTEYAAPLCQFVGFDLTAEEAQQLVDEGRGELVEFEAPSAVYLLQPTVLRDDDALPHPTGAMLNVGGEITAAEALALLRGRVAIGPCATAPAGGVG